MLSPVVGMLNELVKRLQVFGDMFKNLMIDVMGKKDDTSGANSAIGGAIADTSALADNTAKVGDTATATAKKVKKAVAGFDQLNILTENKDDSDKNGDAGIGLATNVYKDQPKNDNNNKFNIDTTAIETAKKLFDDLKKRFLELADLFAKGFTLGAGKDFFDFTDIENKLKSIGKQLLDLWTDADVLASVNKFIDSFVSNIGKVLGSFASIGKTIITAVLGGVDLYLKENSERIKQSIINIFNVGAEIMDKIGNFAVTFADIFSVFKNQDSQKIIADIIGIFSSIFLGVTELAGRMMNDIIGFFTKPIEDNKDKIKSALEDTLKPLSKIFDTIKEDVDYVIDSILKTYKEKISPNIEKVSESISHTFGTILDAYKQYVAPFLDKIATNFQAFSKEHLQPLVDKIMDFVGKFADGFAKVWVAVVQPALDWFIKTAVPIIMPFLETVWKFIVDLASGVADGLGYIFDMLGGIVDFITGICTSDWGLASQGVDELSKGFDGLWNTITTTLINLGSDIIKGIWQAISGLYELTVQYLAYVIDTNMQTLESFIAWVIASIVTWGQNILTQISTSLASLGQWFSDKGTECWNYWVGAFTNLKQWALDRLCDITSGFDSISTWFQTKFTDAYNNLVGCFTNLKQWALDRLADITLSMDSVATWFQTKFTEAYNNLVGCFVNLKQWAIDRLADITLSMDSVSTWFQTKFNEAYGYLTGAFDNTGKFFQGIYDSIVGKFENLGTTIGDKVGNAFKIAVNSTLDFTEKLLNGGIGAINSLGKGSNSLLGTDFTPIEEVSLPRYAQGTYVGANQPRLAIIGDNKTQGEIVSPVDKMKETMMSAIKDSGYGGNSGTAVINLTIQTTLDGKVIKEEVIKGINSDSRLQGKSVLKI